MILLWERQAVCGISSVRHVTDARWTREPRWAAPVPFTSGLAAHHRPRTRRAAESRHAPRPPSRAGPASEPPSLRMPGAGPGAGLGAALRGVAGPPRAAPPQPGGAAVPGAADGAGREPGSAGQRHGAGDGEGGHPHLHGRRQLPAGRPRAVRRGEVRGGRAGAGPPRAERPPPAGLRGRDRRARAHPLLRQGVDLQPRAVRAQQVRAVQAAEPAARRPAGPGVGDRLRGAQLPAHLDCGAFCENLSHDLAFSANHMEEPDRCFRCTILS